jgi:hypothetical protein
VSEVAWLYGWTVDEILNMPWPRFTLMLSEGRRWRAVDYSELCDIQAVSICTTDWYKAQKALYSMQINGADPLPVAPALPRGDAIPAESPQAAGAMFALCGALKKGRC